MSIDIPSSQNSAPLENGPSENIFDPEKPPSEKIGTQIPIGDRGAKIVVVENDRGERKYAIYDAFDVLHGVRFKRSDAEDHATRLPGIPERASHSE